jgi:hypothetical protein
MSETNSQPYELPVSLLLNLGATSNFEPENWEDYPAKYGLTARDVPELLRLAEEKFYLSVEADDPRFHADFHAICALGQLRHPDALAGLIKLAEAQSENAEPLDELPSAIALSGHEALLLLKESLKLCASKFNAAVTLVDCLDQILALFPETRDEIVAICMEQLEEASQNDASVNGHLVATLLDAKAIEALPVIERAYAGKFVDEWVNGDWDDVQVDFGVKEPDPNKRAISYGFPASLTGLRKSPNKMDKKVKNKRKEAQKTRKKNRKRK